jgi:hypothetical protein
MNQLLMMKIIFKLNMMMMMMMKKKIIVIIRKLQNSENNKMIKFHLYIIKINKMIYQCYYYNN